MLQRISQNPMGDNPQLNEEEENSMEEESAEVVEITNSMLNEELGSPNQSGVSENLNNIVLEVGLN